MTHRHTPRGRVRNQGGGSRGRRSGKLHVPRAGRGEGRCVPRERLRSRTILGAISLSRNVADTEDGAFAGIHATGDRVPEQPLSELRSATVMSRPHIANGVFRLSVGRWNPRSAVAPLAPPLRLCVPLGYYNVCPAGALSRGYPFRAWQRCRHLGATVSAAVPHGFPQQDGANGAIALHEGRAWGG